MRRLMAGLLAAMPLLAAGAGEQSLEVCFNYGCQSTQTVVYAPSQMLSLHSALDGSVDAADERGRLQYVLARMYRWAGEQSPIHVDRAGDFLDDEAYGRMDCIDHARTTDRMLHALQAAGALKFHRVVDIQRRTSWVIMQHFSAAIEDRSDGQRYAVDTWFRDHAEPAVVMDLNRWKGGGYPDE